MSKVHVVYQILFIGPRIPIFKGLPQIDMLLLVTLLMLCVTYSYPKGETIISASFLLNIVNFDRKLVGYLCYPSTRTFPRKMTMASTATHAK